MRDSYDEQYRAGRLTQEAAERILRLLGVLMANGCTREVVFEELASYYVRDGDGSGAKRGRGRGADRMFERDLAFLETQGFVVEREHRGRYPMLYRLRRDRGPKLTFLLNNTEIDQLMLIYTMFADPSRYEKGNGVQPLPAQSVQHPFAEGVLTLLDKIVEALPIEQQKYFQRGIQKPYLYFNLAAVTDYLPYRVTIDKIIQAITWRRQIRFEYAPLSNTDEKTIHEQVDPYYVIFMDGHFYCVAYSYTAGKNKTGSFVEFRVDRICAESLEMRADSIDVQRMRRPIEFRFWIDGRIAKRGLSQRWLTQKLEREEAYVDARGKIGTRVLVQASAYNSFRIIQQLLRYGDTVEVVDPPELRAEMKKTIECMLSPYIDK